MEHASIEDDATTITVHDHDDARPRPRRTKQAIMTTMHPTHHSEHGHASHPQMPITMHDHNDDDGLLMAPMTTGTDDDASNDYTQ
jgi:hypothetical protein